MRIFPILFSSLTSLSLLWASPSFCAFKIDDPNLSFYPQNLQTKPIIAYFDSIDLHNQYVTHPVKEGFYRVLMGRNTHGHYLIQDFFQDSSQPQTDPYWVTSIEGLFQFGVEYVEGPIIGYFRNGQVSFKTHMADGKYLHPFESFYPTGEIANRTENLKTGETIDEYFYANGKKALLVKYDKNGKRTQMQVWHENGKTLSDQEAEIVEEDILEKIRFDR